MRSSAIAGWASSTRPPWPWGSSPPSPSGLPYGYSKIFSSYVFGPSGFWTMAPLRYAAKFDPFLSLDCAPQPPPWRNLRKGKEGIKFCHLATVAVAEFFSTGSCSPTTSHTIAIAPSIFLALLVCEVVRRPLLKCVNFAAPTCQKDASQNSDLQEQREIQAEKWQKYLPSL